MRARGGAFANGRVEALNERRGGAALARVYLGLHIGELFSGSIGGRDRLDFTVAGPAEGDVLLSSAFAVAARQENRAGFVSVGRYAPRGVGQAQELSTPEPADGRPDRRD